MTRREWNAKLKPYSTASTHKAVFQIVNTVLPYIALLVLSQWLYNTGEHPVLTTMSIIASSLFMVRTFILFHDCTHGSFFDTKRKNVIFGHLFGILTFTPFRTWQKEHNLHHGAVGNLDRRGVGDIWTMTLEEYQSESKAKRGLYRLFRNPLFLFGVAPFFLFLILQRFPTRPADRKEHASYAMTNLGIALFAFLMSLSFGFFTYVTVQLITLFLAGSLGVWLFYVQHQFEEVYWEHGEQWDSVEAALKGSTFYKLPLPLEWISGYIGYHHIHHLHSGIPNYHLKACYNAFAELKDVKTVTVGESFILANLQIYDQARGRLISFKEVRGLLQVS